MSARKKGEGGGERGENPRTAEKSGVFSGTAFPHRLFEQRFFGVFG